MDVMQCVRAKRGTSPGAVPLGLVMGGQPPPSSLDASGEGERGDVTMLLLGAVLPPHMLNPQAATGNPDILMLKNNIHFFNFKSISMYPDSQFLNT